MLERFENAARSLDVLREVTKEKVGEALDAGEYAAAATRMRALADAEQQLAEAFGFIERLHFDLIRAGEAPEVFPGQREEFRAAFNLSAEPLSPWELIGAES